MNAAVLSASGLRTDFGLRALRAAGRFWFVAAVLGQWLFALYVALSYGTAALQMTASHGGGELPRHFVTGEPIVNSALAAHLFLAFVILVCGPLQFVPFVRERFPAAHRWNGRIYITAAVATAAIGAFVLVTRGTVGDLSQHIGFLFDALLVISFGILAWHSARSRDFAAHRVWVLRLFLAVVAVWFFRVGLMFWIGVNGRAVGFDMNSFTGPFLTFLAFAQTLVPLAVLQLYLHAERRGGPALRVAVAGALLLLTMAMAFGTFIAANVMWLPRI